MRCCSTWSRMSKGLSNSFGLVCLFGILLLLFCFHNQDNLILAIAPRPLLSKITSEDNNSNGLTSKDSNNYNDSLTRNELDANDETKPTTEVNTLSPNTLKNREEEIVIKTEVTLSEKNNHDWPYESPILQGWEPDKSTNLSLYVQPRVNTTLITPRLSFNLNVSALGQDHSKTHVLIVCQSSFSNQSFHLRKAIRESWASEAQNLPVTVIFIFGNPGDAKMQKELENEADMYGDILQEDFVDAYNNLTLKSMFMLKFVTSLLESAPINSIRFLLKVDDDCFVNVKSLLKYTNILDKYSHTIVGHVLGDDSPVIRPKQNSTTQRYTDKWEVPFYIYPNRETFPNALSGSGYLMRAEDLSCLYHKGLKTPFVNLEDIFITGLAARQCHLKLRSSPKFHFMGKHVCHVRHQDILVHTVKEPHMMKLFLEVIRGRKSCKS